MTITIKLDPRTIDVLQKLFGHSSEPTALERLEGKIDMVLQKESQIMAKEVEFQAKIDQINANTTASAAAAQRIADNDSGLKKQLDQVLTDAGVPASVEDAILAKLDASAKAGAALKDFLEATASTPVGTSEPAPVPVPAP